MYIPAVSMSIPHSLRTCNICGIVLWDKTAHFRVVTVASLRHTCAIIMLSDQNLDMMSIEVDEWSQWRRSTHQHGFTHICKYLRVKGLLSTKKVFDIWVQLMKNGSKNKCCVYILVQFIILKAFRWLYWKINKQHNNHNKDFWYNPLMYL